MKSIPKILFIAPTSEIHAGDNISLMNLIEGLRSKSLEIVVICNGSLVAEKFKSKGAKVYALKRASKFTILRHKPKSIKDKLSLVYNFFGLLKGLFKTYYSIKKIVNVEKPDIIHSNTGPSIIGFLLANKFKKKHVWHIREFIDIDFDLSLYISKKRYTKILNNRNNHLIAITKAVKKHHNLKQDTKIIYNGVCKEYQKKFIVSKEDYFLFVGRINSQKGVDVLIDSFIDFCNKDEKYSLLLAGAFDNNKYKVNLSSRIEKSGKSNRIKFLGKRDDVFELMARATALIVPSKNEAFGRITAEAMFNGCLVVGKRTAGTKEILEKDELGILFTDKDELLDKLKKIADKGIESYFNIIKRAQKKAVDLYSQERNANEIYYYYKEILKEEK